MIDTNKTKTLMQASERLHKLNMKYKSLEIEESVFVVFAELINRIKSLVKNIGSQYGFRQCRKVIVKP